MKGKRCKKTTWAERVNRLLIFGIVVASVLCLLLTISIERGLNTLERDLDEIEKGLSDLKKENKSRRQIIFEPEDQVDPVVPNNSYVVTKEEVETLAKIVYREARGVSGRKHKAAIVWCILNRLDNGSWGDNIIEVATYPGAFAWIPDTPVDQDLLSLVIDVVSRWNYERQGLENVGRVLPKDYLYFIGDGEYNYFSKNWKGLNYWDWSLPNPYYI